MRIAAYCRVSTDKAEQLDSLEHQKQFFAEYAARNSHQLVGVYADEGISGTSLKRRTEFQRLMRDAESGSFDTVVAKDISRFARNTVDFLQSIRRLKALGINTLFLTANMESLGESEFILTVFSALAQEESINLSKRVKFGKKINAEKGRVPPCIFGYDRKDNFTLEINGHEASTVRLIYRLYLEDMYGCQRIADWLNGSGYKTKFGCEWSARGVRRVLTNPIYCGDYVNNKYEVKDCLQGRQTRLPEEQNFHHSRPQWAIVSPQVFCAAQTRMSERAQRYAATSECYVARQSEKHVFSTVIECQSCGRSFCRKQYTYTKTRTYWKCQTNDREGVRGCKNRVTLTQDRLLAQIKDYLCSLIGEREGFIASVIEQYEKRDLRQKNESELTARIARLKLKKARYGEMYAEQIISMSELRQKTEALDGEISVLHKQCEEIKTEQGSCGANCTDTVEKFLSFENVTNADIKKLIRRITVDCDGKIKIYWRASCELCET